MMATVEMDTTGLDKMLAKLPIELRGKVIKFALVRAGNKIVSQAKKDAPVGDPNHKPELKPLKETIGQVFRDYENGKFMQVVGPKYPAGSHGHLVEEGHRMVTRNGQTVGFVEGKKWMAKAVAKAEPQAKSTFVEKLAEGFEKYSKEA